MNPLAYLLPAIVALLKAPPLTWDGADVPAYEHLPGNSSTRYVLLSQPTAADAPGAARCRHWSCTALVEVTTQFPAGLVSSAPAEAIATQVIGRLQGTEGAPDYPRLGLPAGYDSGPASLELHSELKELNNGLLTLRRLLRYRWEVIYNL